MKKVIILLTMLLVGAGLFAQDAKTGKDTTGVMMKYRRSRECSSPTRPR